MIALNDEQHAEFDEGGVGLLQRRGEAGLHGVELDDDGRRLLVEGGEHVKGGNARDVASAEHERDARLAVRVAQRSRDTATRLVERDSGPQPEVSLIALQYEVFRQIREYPQGRAAPGCSAELDMVDGRQTAVEHPERLLDGARGRNDGIRPARPLFSRCG